jgi:hypothetical protein
MADEGKTFQVIIIPEHGARTYSLRFRRSLFYVAAAIVILAIALFGYMTIVHRGLLSKALRADRLEQENDILRSQALKISQLEGELARLGALRQQIYEMAGVDDPLSAGGHGAAMTGHSNDPAVVHEAGIMAGAGYGDLVLDDPVHGAPALGDSLAAQEAASASREVSAVPSLWPVRGWVTAEFDESLPGREQRHRGLDIAASQGSPILAAAGGQVSFSDWDTDLGKVVVVDHENGLRTLYGHCDRVVVQVGERVVQGQVIAHLGNTGRSSAPHLHFEIRENGIPIDPRGYLGP